MGWIYQGSAYCQLIIKFNKVKRLEFAVNYLNNTIFSDKITVQLDTYRCRCYRKEAEKSRLNLILNTQ